VVDVLRAIWTVAERSDDDEKAKLKHDIAQAVHRLKNRVESRLGNSTLADAEQARLFDETGEQPSGDETLVSAPAPSTRFPEPSRHVCAKDFADHALQHLPQSAKFQSVTDFRDYLADKLGSTRPDVVPPTTLSAGSFRETPTTTTSHSSQPPRPGRWRSVKPCSK
jgi:hypothetical protein